ETGRVETERLPQQGARLLPVRVLEALDPAIEEPRLVRRAREIERAQRRDRFGELALAGVEQGALDLRRHVPGMDLQCLVEALPRERGLVAREANPRQP